MPKKVKEVKELKEIKTVSGVPESKVRAVAQKVESQVEDGYKILLERWNTPVAIEIDGVTFHILRPNLKQTTMLLGAVTKLSQPPTDPNEIAVFLDDVRQTIAPVLASLIVKPEELSDESFWLEGDYPFDFLIKIMNAVTNVFNESITSVETFREE